MCCSEGDGEVVSVTYDNIVVKQDDGAEKTIRFLNLKDRINQTATIKDR